MDDIFITKKKTTTSSQKESQIDEEKQKENKIKAEKLKNEVKYKKNFNPHLIFALNFLQKGQFIVCIRRL
jgi:hypothetical protein